MPDLHFRRRDVLSRLSAIKGRAKNGKKKQMSFPTPSAQRKVVWGEGIPTAQTLRRSAAVSKPVFQRMGSRRGLKGAGRAVLGAPDNDAHPPPEGRILSCRRLSPTREGWVAMADDKASSTSNMTSGGDLGRFPRPRCLAGRALRSRHRSGETTGDEGWLGIIEYAVGQKGLRWRTPKCREPFRRSDSNGGARN